MLRIVPRGDRHDPRDLTVGVRVEGTDAAAFLDGRSDRVLPGETLKNLVHSAVRTQGTAELETLGIEIAGQIVSRQPAFSRLRIEIAEERWQRLSAGGRLQPQSFLSGSDERRLAVITSNGRQLSVIGGLDGLTVMRSAGFRPSQRQGSMEAEDSGFFDGQQRLLVGTLAARWTYTSPEVTFGVYREGVRAAMLDTLAWHESQSVQHALYAISDVVLSTYAEVAEITLAFHERPYRPADPFASGPGGDDLFLVLDEPIGTVEVTVSRT